MTINYNGKEYNDTDVKRLVKCADGIYEAFYMLEGFDVINYRKYVDLFDKRMKEIPAFKELVCAMAYVRQDIYSSDRECAAACLAIIQYNEIPWRLRHFNREI